MVRVRFAPSPTGPLHIGGVRTALYNYLFARKMGGKMLLRIEDTDQTRFVPGAEDYILEALKWCGIEIDEGQGVGGEHAPYRQSERKPIYREYAEKLVQEGKAYYAFDTADELEDMRKRLEDAKVDNPSYNGITRMQMTNSLTLPKNEIENRLKNGDNYVIRLKVPVKEEIRFKDIVRDWVSVHSSSIDDKVLLKSDGMPTYHLANIVDDYLMEITHVIRGEEWLPSAPLHILLYRAFGWEAPQFAHLPLLLKPEGNGKLSKRDGLLGNFPIFPLQWEDPFTGETARGFREDGYLPDAVINFLAFLGWNPGTEQEIFSMGELISAFSLEKIHKAGARFDINKAKWFNQNYLKQTPNEDLIKFVQAHHEVSDEKAAKIAGLMKERVIFPQEIATDAPFIFDSPTTYDEEIAKNKWDDNAKNAMKIIADSLQMVDNQAFTVENIHNAIFENLEKAGIKPGKVMQALRLAITGVGKGPDLMLTMEIIGKEESTLRIKNALERIKN
jgi:glutamyl-tRNA synthetase